MPAKSKAQQKAAGAALAAKRGEIGKDELKGASREMVEVDDRERARGAGLDQAQGQARARLEVLTATHLRRAAAPSRAPRGFLRRPAPEASPQPPGSARHSPAAAQSPLDQRGRTV